MNKVLPRIRKEAVLEEQRPHTVTGHCLYVDIVNVWMNNDDPLRNLSLGVGKHAQCSRGSVIKGQPKQEDFQ